MNIRDIAKAAGVSPATVSRVLNHRDEALTLETRARVQRIIREMNYSPYAAREGHKPSRLIGVLLYEDRNNAQLLSGIEEVARKEGYGVLVQFLRPGDEENNIISLLRSRHADGIICQGSASSDEIEYGFPTIRLEMAGNPPFAYSDCAAQLTNMLLAYGHTRIACITGDSAYSEAFSAGYKKAMQDASLIPESPFPLTDSMAVAKLYRCTAAVCQTYESARRLSTLLSGLNIRIPENFSVVCIRRDTTEQSPESPMTCCLLSENALGRQSARRLIERIEGQAGSERDPELTSFLDNGTIAVPDVQHIPSILVAGTVNMDTMLCLSDFPECGSTNTVMSRTVMPGGKGLNQAIGCRRLGAEVALLGRLGRDFEGATLYSYLQENGVKMAGVSMDPVADTGYACITVNRDGESTILIDRGANACLTSDDIRKNEQLFEGVGFCLLQTELPVEIAITCARLAHRHGAKVIVKPCNKPVLPDELLALTDYLIPNRHELRNLCPGDDSQEEKARRLIQRGCSCVIVTMGRNGCMLVTADSCRSFPAAKVHVLDTTGACDAFAAALAVFLLRGEPLEKAIIFANCAAGLSCEQLGVSVSLPDLTKVRQLYRTIQ